MTSFRIRPKFEFYTQQSSEHVISTIKEALAKANEPFDFVEFPGHIILRIRKELQHYWSPQLNLELLPEEERTLIKGRYEPHPNVWTLFVLCYLALGIMALFVGIIGFSRRSLDMPATILWILPALAVCALLLYLVSQLGQKLGAEETFDLHHFLESHLDVKIHIH